MVWVIGTGGSDALPHLARDPIPAACAMVLGLQTLESREVDVTDPVVLSDYSIHAGSTFNVIPAEATWQGTFRTFSPAQREQMLQPVSHLCTAMGDAPHVAVEVTWGAESTVTVNDTAQAEFATQTAIDLFGPDRGLNLPPARVAEDFSKVLAAVPGAYSYLATEYPGTWQLPPLPERRL